MKNVIEYNILYSYEKLATFLSQTLSLSISCP